MKKSLLILFILLALTVFPGRRVQAAGANYSLSPATSIVSVGDALAVDVVADTGGVAVTRFVVVISFDTTKLQVVDSDSTTAGTQIRKGTLTTQPPTVNKVDVVAGKITYDSGTLTTPYSSRGVLATIIFKTIAKGTVTPTISFTESQMLGTGGTNSLEVATNGTYVIQDSATSVTPPATTTTSPNASTSGTTKGGLPSTGVFEDTLAVLLLGGGLLFGSWVLGKKMI